MLLKEKQGKIHFYQEVARKFKNLLTSNIFCSTALEEQSHNYMVSYVNSTTKTLINMLLTIG